LRALLPEHRDALNLAAADGALWRLWYTSVPAASGMSDYIGRALEQWRSAVSLPFVVHCVASGAIVGCTRYCNIDGITPRLEIGYTWYAQRVQRTAVNTECKLLLLRHAFETLKVSAVEFRTHWFNQASRVAIARLGAKQDGVLRQHQRMPDGSYRDTVVFSILNGEWPAVRQQLRFRLGEI